MSLLQENEIDRALMSFRICSPIHAFRRAEEPAFVFRNVDIASDLISSACTAKFCGHLQVLSLQPFFQSPSVGYP
jgi:hypothetical protein